MLKGFCHSSLLTFAAIVTASAAMLSCSDSDEVGNLSTGTFSLSLEIDDTLHNPDGSVAEGIKAARPDDSEIAVRMQAAFADYTHTWESYSQMPQGEKYFAGTYQIDATAGYSAEGYNSPFYYGSTTVEVREGASTESSVKLSLVSAVTAVKFDNSLTDAFRSVKAYLHSDGGGYYEYVPSDTQLLYLIPGRTTLMLSLTLPDGRVAGFEALTLDKTESACLYVYDISFSKRGEAPEVLCKVGDKSRSIALTEEFLSAQPPVIVASGWSEDASLLLPEGDDPAEPVVASVSSTSPLAHLYLSVNSPSLRERGFPVQVDLLSLPAETETLLRSLGLVWGGSPTAMTVDFSSLLGNLTYLTALEALSTFGLSAVDDQGRVGPPTMLRVETTVVDVAVKDTPDVMVGASTASITVESTAVDFASHVAVELLSDGNDGLQWTATPVTEVTSPAEGRFKVSFEIPDGSDPVEGRVIYCGEPRNQFTLKRYMPEFTLDVDPFATFALLKVNAASPELVAEITKRLYPYVNGSRASVLSRNSETGIIAMSGLQAASTYTLTSTMMDSPSEEDFTPASIFTTEAIRQLPNAGFEDRNNGPTYKNLPSGGRYSQTVVAIFNWQNHETFEMQEPKEWANTNAKTFNAGSKNHNTWYMQPSVFTVTDNIHSGNFAVCLRSVGFDTDGEAIPDYTQTGEPYLKYSPIVPRISSRAAGKLFLGSYAFNPSTLEEVYNDIVPWGSRPVSLNGYYRYNPSGNDPSDAGVALVEVYGKVDGEVKMIASASVYLPVANSYTAFSANLNYEHFGVKATGIKVMFASSHSTGTIAEETANIETVDDAVKACSTGSTLWLDHVNLSY